ncbi:ARM repeat-containing protein [Wallemia mellicola CBS 633.66]|uniref:ARM repeat-containing protein n=1 Tax=Wallemia mellicola (strain ATCC MYA-4683 / CBS 633.66) TaxID=671144 RepID=I4YJL6_WALMC|nr:ARM repeat-containing protein [Wallemia mellicola CBS 633.66]EIM24158.1 ARM repeat-containing protein [Wallemia mellicola CBS 633.66]|eukprot:XP_006955657.1 ARM repeat-containing protein [Wallemia mellicola CBS 633.66]
MATSIDDDDDDGRSDSADDNDNGPIHHKSPEDYSKDLSTATQKAQEAQETKEPVKYVPPAVRAAKEHELQQRSSSNVQKSEDMHKINKVVKGSLNRLSEANIETILGQLQELYRNKPRHDVTTSITDLILSTIGSRDNMLDSFVILYAGFTGSLHRLVGIEFMAYITQTIIKKLDEKPLYQVSEDEVRSNLNLISLLSELYNLGSISVSLIYDLIKSLISTDKLNEAQIDAVLRITRSAGQQLRHDDPGSLKEIVLAIQNKVEHIEKDELSSRFKFMLECLNNLKNNKTKALSGTSNGIESRDRIKKYLKNLEKRPGVASTEALTVSLDDLRQADSKGKWWLVGSAWSGNPLVDKKDEFSKNKKADDDVLIKLAKRQGMNTDVRRNIFIILMSSEDYIDACDRLSNLGLTEVQQREIIRVILHCGGNEKRYNPYYTLVASHLLRQSHSTRITLQYAIWDFLRELGESSVGGSEILKNSTSSGDGSNVRSSRIDNLAKGLAWWVAKSSVPLSIFKPVIFPTLSPKAKDFFNKFFVYLFLSTYSSSPTLNLDSKKGDKSIIEGIMIKAAPISNLANGIKWYLNHIDLNNLKERELEISEWCINHSVETLKLGMDLSNY